MKTIYKFELRRGRSIALIFTAACTALLFFSMLLYPMMKDMFADLNKALESMGDFAELMGEGSMDYASAADYFASECGLMYSLCAAALAAFLGGALLGREEGERTGEWLLTHPVSRNRILFGKFFSMVTLLLAMNVVSAAIIGLSFPLIGEPLDLKVFLLFYAAQFVMHLEIGCISLLLSAVMHRSAGAAAFGISMGLCFLNAVIASVEELDFIGYVIPFTYCDAISIFSEGKLDIISLAIGAAVSVVCVILAKTIWCKKDISA